MVNKMPNKNSAASDPTILIARVRNNFKQSIQTTSEIMDELAPLIVTAAVQMSTALLSEHKILACGNGGSAADAQHFSAEMLNRLISADRDIPAGRVSQRQATIVADAAALSGHHEKQMG